MSRPAVSIAAFGVYLLTGGLLLLFVPGWTCSLVGLSAPGDPLWVRVCGFLFVDLAFYCLMAARSDQREFMRWSVPTRSSLLGFLLIFVAVGIGQPVLVLFGLIDLAAAAWTAWALHTTPPAVQPG